MSSPIELSGLPVATSALITDVTLLRSGLTDYQLSVIDLFESFDISALSELPSQTPDATDFMLINRANVNYKISFEQVGFIAGVQMWFYNGPPSSNWSIVAGTGDTLLGVSDNSKNYNSVGGSPPVFGQLGTWQQIDTVLTTSQIPAHTHTYFLAGSGSAPINLASGSSTNHATVNADSGSTGGGQGHNHGNLWRPAASVGCICQKMS